MLASVHSTAVSTALKHASGIDTFGLHKTLKAIGVFCRRASGCTLYVCERANQQ